MRIVICEDEKYWQDKLKASVLNWAKYRKVELCCNSFISPQKLIDYLTIATDIDVVFLDVLPGNKVMDGVTAAIHIRKMGSRVPIIFVASDSARAVDGYLVEAMGFLCKPIDIKRLSLFMDKILKQQKSAKIIKIIIESSVINIVQSDIIYVEVNNHTITFHTRKRKIELRGTLKKILELLGNDDFVQIHRSFAVSKSRIVEVNATYPYFVSLVNDKEIIELPLSRNYRDKLLEMYSDDALEMMI